MIDLLEDGEEYKFNIKQADANMENTVERTLAKYYSQIEELNHKLKFTRRYKFPATLE